MHGFATNKPLIGKTIKTVSKKEMESLTKLGFQCNLCPNTEYKIDDFDHENNCPIVNGNRITHRAFYTVKRTGR